MTTSSLKARLEGKPRRRVDYLVQVADATEAEASLEAARRALAVLEITGAANDPERADEYAAAKAAQEKAAADVAACFEQVWFVALPNLDMEILTAAHVDAKGDIVRATIGPELAGACAEDPELQDADWWREQLASPRWSSGDKDSLIDRLLRLNWDTPPDSLPKG